MKSRHANNTLIFAALMSASFPSGAITIYKHQLHDGSILYSQDRTVKGKLLKRIQVPPQTQQQIAAGRAAERKLLQQFEFAERLGKQRAEQAARAGEYVSTGTQMFVPTYPPFFTMNPRLPGYRYVAASGWSRLVDPYWAQLASPDLWEYMLLRPEPAHPPMLLAR